MNSGIEIEKTSPSFSFSP